MCAARRKPDNETRVPIEIAPNVFAFNRHDDQKEYTTHVVAVVGPTDREAAPLGLAAAAQRFMIVGEDGRWYPDGIPDAPAGEEIYTPNYASDVTLGALGPWLYLDCKSYIAPPMAQTLKRILAEELERAGVTDARVEVPSDVETHGVADEADG